MLLVEKRHFLQDVCQMTAIAFVSVINHYRIDGLHLFWLVGLLGFKANQPLEVI